MYFKKPFLLGLSLTILPFLVLLTFSQAQAQKGVIVNVGVPNQAAPGATVTVTFQVNNNTLNNITFDRVAIAYALQDLIVRGPYQRVLGIQTVHPTDSDNFDPSFSFTIPKNTPVGTITTVMVSLFESTYDNTGARAVGAKGISIAK